MGELRTPTQPAICPDSRWAAPPPNPPSAALPGPPPGSPGAWEEQSKGQNLAWLPWTSPSGTSKGQGRMGERPGHDMPPRELKALDECLRARAREEKGEPRRATLLCQAARSGGVAAMADVQTSVVPSPCLAALGRHRMPVCTFFLPSSSRA